MERAFTHALTVGTLAFYWFSLESAKLDANRKRPRYQQKKDLVNCVQQIFIQH